MTEHAEPLHELKKIRPESVPRALAKAERYRLLNEPRAAESICRDILAVEPADDKALKILILALTDQFPRLKIRPEEPRELLAQLPDEYSRHYYSGVIQERWAKALLGADYPAHTVYNVFNDAMAEYDKASAAAPTDNEDATLRWNTCARIIHRRGLRPAPPGSDEAHPVESFDDEVPYR